MIDMELPDKIYVTTCSINSWYGYKFGCWTERECPGNAYISKDTLLEWAKEKKQQLLEQDPSDVAVGMNAGFDMIIGKLNSM